MTNSRRLIPVAVALGVVLVVVAIVYFAEPASSLSSFFPGHQAGSSHHHGKHGIAALGVAAAAFAFAWFATGPRQPAATGA